MKSLFIALATMPFAFSACKTSPAESRKMTEPAMHATMTGEAHGPGMMGSSPAMAQPVGVEPAMANGVTMAVPAGAKAPAMAPAMAPTMAPAMAGGAAPSSSMGPKSKRAMKMADDKKGQVAGTRL
jgi:hypothetical protein